MNNKLWMYNSLAGFRLKLWVDDCFGSFLKLRVNDCLAAFLKLGMNDGLTGEVVESGEVRHWFGSGGGSSPLDEPTIG